MNEILKAMKERRSSRKFTSELPPKEAIDQVIEAGLYAASGHGSQQTIIVAVTNQELLAKFRKDNCAIGGWNKDFDPFYGAPVALVVLAKKDCPTNVYDGSLVMGNLMLAAHALGLGSCWINRAREEFETEEYKELLRSIGVEGEYIGEYIGVGHCALGYAADPIPAPPERKPNRVFYVD